MKFPNRNITLTKYDSREKWLIGRHKAIGASDVSTLFTLNSFTNVVELFWNKVRLSPAMPHNINTVSGEIMEPVIAKYFTHYDPERPTDEVMIQNFEAGKVVRKINRFRRNIWMNDAPLSCTLDYVSPSIRAVVECKNVLGHVVNRYENGILPGHLLQLQTQLMVTGLERGVLAYFVDGRFYREWVIERDLAFQAEIKERAIDFWNTRIIPARKVWNDPLMSEQEKMILIYDNFEPEIDSASQDSLQKFMNTRFKESSKLGKLMITPDLQVYIDGYRKHLTMESQAGNSKDQYGNEIRSALIAHSCDEITALDGKIIASYRANVKGALTLRVN